MSDIAGIPVIDVSKEWIERKLFVQAALSYIGTPYHHHGRVKGAGVDCATLLLCAAQEAGLVPLDFDLGEYSPQWHMNRTAQKYLAKIAEVTHEVDFPALPGDIILFQFGHVFSHSGVVVEWPRIVHAYVARNVVVDDAERAQWLKYMGESDNRERPRKLVSFWPR